MSETFYIQSAKGAPLPIIISCPHSGMEIPPDVASTMVPEMAKTVPDTDWFVHELYGFAPTMGITVVHARFSRFVIDLNRDPANQPLYADGRHQTGLVPTTAFDKRPIYPAAGPTEGEIKRRLDLYYRPYHLKLAQLVAELRSVHPHVLVFEAHSIKRLVPTIQAAPFPDMILGDQRGKTAAAALTRAAMDTLARSRFAVSHNEPFMGGYITRHFGKPDAGVHTLQLEMSQDIYMDEKNASRDPRKQLDVQAPLRATMSELGKVLRSLP